jgi:hypothetical protein
MTDPPSSSLPMSFYPPKHLRAHDHATLLAVGQRVRVHWTFDPPVAGTVLEYIPANNNARIKFDHPPVKWRGIISEYDAAGQTGVFSLHYLALDDPT